MNWLSRTQSLIGKDALSRLQNSTVAVVGLGGVGGSCAEALCRSGVGHLILVDFDTFDLTNINRQLFATTKTVDGLKTEIAKQRLLEIAPQCKITICNMRYDAQTAEHLFAQAPDFVADAIDMVSAKVDLLTRCAAYRIPSVSCMGTGNRLDPQQLHIGTLADTAGCGCGLARVMRHELRKHELLHQPVVYSTEPPCPVVAENTAASGRHTPASIAFLPPVAGYFLAFYAVRKLIADDSV